MDWELRVKEFWQRHPSLELPLAAVERLCKPCAEAMKSYGITALKLDGKQMPPGMKEGLCDEFSPAEGFFERCVGGVSDEIDDKEAFCAWLHNECLGKFPSEKAAGETPPLQGDFEKRLREADLEALESFRAGKGEAPVIYKPEGRAQQQGQTLVFVASEESEDRLGDTILIGGWELGTFFKNPAFMWAHDYTTAPIGIVPRVWVEEKRLLNTVAFDMADEFAAFIAGKYERGFLKGESVGYRVLDFAPKAGGRGIIFKRQELLEISAVPIPAHPAAIRKAMGDRKFSIIKPEPTPALWLPQEKPANEQGGKGSVEPLPAEVTALASSLRSLGEWAKKGKGDK